MAKSKKIDKDMGFRLKKARLDQKLTYDELSEMSGVSSRYIKEIENHGNIPSLEKLGQLIRALHISADPFFYPAAPTDNLDYQRLLVYLSQCTEEQITTILAIVEAMKLMNEVVADEDGVVEEILVQDQSFVEYHQVLMKMK